MEVDRYEAVDRVYRSDHVRLQRALLAHCGRPHIAADAEAEAFRQALSTSSAIKNHTAWIWATAFKVANGLLATAGAPLASVEELADHCSNSPDDLVEFLGLLETLSDQQRAIVALRYVGGFSSNEIAELIASTPGSVRVQLHRAHQHLKERLVRS